MQLVPKSYRPWTPTQSYLLPPSPLEWLPKDHLAYFVLDLACQLDLSAIDARIADKDPRGEKPYAPAMMLGLLVYGYATGVYSRQGSSSWGSSRSTARRSGPRPASTAR
jgi:hypothetical protein